MVGLGNNTALYTFTALTAGIVANLPAGEVEKTTVKWYRLKIL